MRTGQHPCCAAQMAGDHLGLGFLDQKSGAVKEPLQTARPAHAPFGKQDQLAAGLQMRSHFLQTGCRISANQDNAFIAQNPLVQFAGAGGQFGGCKFPVRLHAQAHEQPVQPGQMIGDQQHGAVALRGFLIESAEAEPYAEHAAHQLEKKSVGPNIHRWADSTRNPTMNEIDIINVRTVWVDPAS